MTGPEEGSWVGATDSDEVEGAADVVVIGHDIWRSRLADDPNVIGSTVYIGRVPHTVVGVMPKGFLFPVSQSLWLPLRANPQRSVQYDDHACSSTAHRLGCDPRWQALGFRAEFNRD